MVSLNEDAKVKNKNAIQSVSRIFSQH